ncbi:MAG: YfcC family protein [Bacteroidales bacterium]|nr:YfcC family protein [Bacteroidales bacterium]
MGKKREFPNTYVIIFAIILLCAASTWFTKGAVPQTWQVFSALYDGFSKQAGIIIFILVIGGAFWIVNYSKAVDAGIYSFLNFTSKLETNVFLRKIGVNNVIMVFIMLLFSLFGAVFGMSEETIAFIVIFVPLAISMGYDSIVGVCLVYVAAHVGFAGAMLNPFTIGIAQDMAGLPLFSGIEYRFFCWIVLTVIMMVFVLIYAAKVKKNPHKSIMYEADGFWREKVDIGEGKIEYYHNRSSWVSFGLAAVAIILFTVFYSGKCVIGIGLGHYSVPWLLPVAALLFILFSLLSLKKSVHFYILTLLCFAIVYLVIGVLCFSWYMGEISALFLALAILSGIACGLRPNGIVKEFLCGAKDILSAAMVVGLAAGIVIILQNGQVLDPMLNGIVAALDDAGSAVSLGLMYGIQTLINLVIPSASAKAAITMPIMAPFSDMIGVSRQATVLAFQFGDGFTNMITPTSGVLVAVLGMARIPYAKWVKFIWKFILTLIVIGFLLLLLTLFLTLPGF